MNVQLKGCRPDCVESLRMQRLGPSLGLGQRWWRIVSAGVKRVTLTQALDRKQASTQCAVQSDALERVRRARWSEAAHRSDQVEDQLRQRQLIAPDQQHQQARHDTILSTPARCASSSCSAGLADGAAQRFVELGAQRRVGHRNKTRANDHHHIPRTGQRPPMISKPFANSPFREISTNRVAGFARRDDPQAGHRIVGVANVQKQHEIGSTDADRLFLSPEVVAALAHAAIFRIAGRYFFQVETARRLRPLRRRWLMIFRPLFVFMRARKPCVRSRLVLCG